MINNLWITFKIVAQCGSFTRAAREIFISATAVRKQINMLEEQIGMQLFYRGKKGIELTPEGESIYSEMDGLLDLSRSILGHARACSQKKINVFRIGTSLLNPASVFINIWQQTDNISQSSIQLVQYDDNRKGILSEISRLGKKYDFLVAACNSNSWLKLCKFHKLGDYQICCAVPRGHRLQHKKSLELKDLHGECVMLGERGDSERVDKTRDILECEKNIRLESISRFYDLEIFNQCERQGKILLTLECWKHVHPAIITIPVDWDCSVPYGLLYSNNLGNEINDFLKLLSSKDKYI